MHAITRNVSPALAQCALTFLDRQTIDPERAQRQHRHYERCLQTLGLRLISLPAEPDLPDAVFVEDTAVVVEEAAVMTRPRLDSRRPEVDSIAAVLTRYRPLLSISDPGTIEGGDVIRVGRTLYVGISSRTNEEAARQLADLLEPWGYEIHTVPVQHCLHLKTACTYIGRDTVLANPDWVDTSVFRGLKVIAVGQGEDEAGNAVHVDGSLLMPAAFPLTRARLDTAGFDVATVDVSELQKAEAGVTCCSILFS